MIAAGTFALVVGDSRGIGSQPLADRVSLALEDWAAEGASWSVVAAQTLSVLAAAAQPQGAPAGGSGANRIDELLVWSVHGVAW